MAEEKNNEAVQEKSGFDFKIIIIGLAVFLITIGASYFMLRSLIAPLVPEKEDTAVVGEGNLVTTGEMTMNIDDPEGTRYLKFELYMEVADATAAEEITKIMPIVKDVVMSTIGSKTSEELAVKNRENIKKEIKKKINTQLQGDVVQNVFFNSFVMQ